jgi:hypothetical protein
VQAKHALSFNFPLTSIEAHWFESGTMSKHHERNEQLKSEKQEAETSEKSNVVHLHKRPETTSHTGLVLATHEIDRKRFYISQRGDFSFRSYMFGCGPSSLTEALADWGAINPRTGEPAVHQPPTESDRRRLIVATGTMSAGKFPGGPDLMCEFAKKYGLHAESHGPSRHELDRVLAEGKGAIVGGSPSPGHGHYIYVAGIDKDGYIVGDPAHPKVTHWTRQHLERFMHGRRGFVAVWTGQEPSCSRCVVDAGGAGYIPTPIVDRQVSVLPETGRRSGNNGSLFKSPRPEKANLVSAEGKPVQTDNSSANGTTNQNETSVAPPSNTTEVANNNQQSNQSYGSAIPRTFPPPKPNQDVGDSTTDNIPDDASLEDGLSMQDTTDRVTSYVVDQDNAFTSVEHDPSNANLISIGAGNWHQQGDMPELFSAWAHDDPQDFKKIFGQDGQHLLNADWVKNHDFTTDPKLMVKVREALANTTMQKTQTNMTRQLVSQSVALGYEAGFRSQPNFAIISDACNQAGFGAVKSALNSSDVRTAIAQGNETQAMSMMQAHLHIPAARSVVTAHA